MTWYHTNISSTPSTSSQEQEAAFSLTSYLDTIRLERAKSNPTQEMSSSPDNETDTCQTSQSGTTYAHSTEHPGEEQLMFFAEDSHVRTSVRQVKEQELAESVRDFGRNMRDSLERCGLALSLPKTHLCFALGELELSSKTWPRWGIMLDGECSELGMSVRHISETECGSWPTPLARDWKDSGNPEKVAKSGRDESVPRRCAKDFGKIPSPKLPEWMMGWPIGWTGLKDLKPSAMGRFRNVQQWHSLFSQKD